MTLDDARAARLNYLRSAERIMQDPKLFFEILVDGPDPRTAAERVARAFAVPLPAARDVLTLMARNFTVQGRRRTAEEYESLRTNDGSTT